MMHDEVVCIRPLLGSTSWLFRGFIPMCGIVNIYVGRRARSSCGDDKFVNA